MGILILWTKQRKFTSESLCQNSNPYHQLDKDLPKTHWPNMTPADNSPSDHGTRKTHHQVLEQLKEINVIISCITWEHLHLQIPWIEAAKEAGVKRFVPSEWVEPAPREVIDIKDKGRLQGLTHSR